jgi:hypothetical protein
MDLSDYAKDLFVEANDGPLAPFHRWLTNRIKTPTAINTAIRIPTTNEITGRRPLPDVPCGNPWRPNAFTAQAIASGGRGPVAAARTLTYLPMSAEA